MLAGLGHPGRVPSPTYTLVEPYLLPRFRVLHVDLYRLRDPAELDDLGLADELGPPDAAGRGSVLLAEWPQRGRGRLPPADLVVALAVAGEGRTAVLSGRTAAGEAVTREVRRAVQAGF
jgi:tRNA threonylcarbamoyladenosine biosynthesis protein TsaE